MARTQPGKRYPLLLYTRLLAMYRGAAFWLAALFLIIGWVAPSAYFALIPPSVERWAFLGAAVSGAFFLFTLLGKRLSYVQCYPDHIRIQTTILRLNVSYSRVGEVRPVNFNHFFPPSRQKWSQRRFLQPIFGQTCVGLTLNGYPMPERVLRLFFSPYMFLPDRTGFLLLAKDWMELSAEIGKYREKWLTRRAAARRASRPRSNPFGR